ncbi:MAG: S-adenosylmethionine decarboxylase [Patescibacteria group bacterium]
MKDLAPSITRQRLLIEATYEKEVNEDNVREFLAGLCKELELRVYGDPIIHSPSGEGKEENQGFDAFIPLIDSGIALYIWTNKKFLSIVIYTCKEFSEQKALDYTRNYFNTIDLESSSF